MYEYGLSLKIPGIFHFIFGLGLTEGNLNSGKQNSDKGDYCTGKFKRKYFGKILDPNFYF